MTRRGLTPGPGTSPPKDLLNPGLARKQRILDPVREAHKIHGVYRPSNKWRNHPHPDGDVRQRALNLAKKLPWNHKFNFARS